MSRHPLHLMIAHPPSRLCFLPHSSSYFDANAELLPIYIAADGASRCICATCQGDYFTIV